jgi:hypothetical protein
MRDGMPRRRRGMRASALLGTCLVTMATACGEGATGVVASSDPTPTETTALRLAAAGMTPKTSRPEPGAIAVALTSITVDRAGDHDRAIFEFTGTAAPGWAVQYVTRAIDNDTGTALAIPGESVLEVLLLDSASSVQPGTSYAGPRFVSATNAAQIELVRYTTARAGVTQAFIGIAGHEPAFTVSALSSPTRIVVDVADGST